MTIEACVGLRKNWMTGTHNFTLSAISKIEAILGRELLLTP